MLATIHSIGIDHISAYSMIDYKIGDADINTLKMKQYLALTRRNQAPSVVKPEIRGNVNFKIKRVTHGTVILRVFPITLIGAAKRKVSNDSSVGIEAITNKLDSLGKDMKKRKENACYPSRSENCRGAHLNKDCLLNEEVKGVEEVKYGEFGRPFPNNNRNGGRYRVGPPGYYTRIDNQPTLRERRLKTIEKNQRGYDEIIGNFETKVKALTGEEIEYFFADSSLLDEEVQEETKEAKEIKDEAVQLENKLRTSKDEDVKMNTRCSTIIQDYLPPKEQDPGSFTLPYSIGKLNLIALANLGAKLPKSQPKKTYKEDLECETVMVKMPRCMSFLGSTNAYDEPIGSLGMMNNEEVPSFDELEPQPNTLPNCPPLDISLGDKRGPEPPIKPHSLDSFTIKEVENLTIHTPPLPHVASYQPKDMYYYYHPCIDDHKKHYGFKPGLLGHSGSLGIDFLNLEMIEDDWQLEFKEVSFLREGLNLPVRPNELEHASVPDFPSKFSSLLVIQTTCFLHNLEACHRMVTLLAETATDDTGTSTTLIPGLVIIEEKAKKKNDVKARSMLVIELPNEYLMTFNQYKDANTLFAAIETRFSGNEATKKTQKTLLKQLYENFSAIGIDLPSEWNTHVVVWRNKSDLDTISLDGLYNNFKIVEQKVRETTSTNTSSQNMSFVSSLSPNSTNEVPTVFRVSTASPQVSTANLSDATVYAFLDNQPNRSQLVHEDLEQIHEDDLEKIDLKWQLARLSMRAKRFFQKTSKKITINESDTDGYDKAKSYMADDEAPTNMAFMALSDSEENNSAPLIEDWESDEEDEDWESDEEDEVESPPEKERKTVKPSVDKVEVEIPKQNDKPTRRPVKYAEMYRTQRPRGNQRNWNNLKIHQLGNISYLTDFKEFDGGYVAFWEGAKGGKITGKATIRTEFCHGRELNPRPSASTHLHLVHPIQLNSTLAKITKQMTSITSLCEMACQIFQKNLEEKQLEEERAAKAQNWKISVCYDDDDDEERFDSLDDNIISELPPFSAITPNEPVLSIEEPDNSLSMGNEHLDTIPATESDEFIKSGVEDLIIIPSESEGTPEHVCDVPSYENSLPLDVSKDQIEDFSESNEEFSSTDDDSFSFDKIDYVEVSPPDSELVSSKVMEIVTPEDLPSNDSLSFAEKESFHFDIPPFSRPPANPPDGDTGILNIKMMGDIYDQKAFMHKLMITLAPHQEKYLDLLSHRCGTVKKSILTVVT
uniref:Ribonuclease H-like domain-containing protein n=1 Tax=Tanacetum cinerariifolium TaxID=118510 RepID=A0A6L2LAH6_TANCI|nr:ribonuclease H-like domain-containing protein [Tanacetum cinerariifolium]